MEIATLLFWDGVSVKQDGTKIYGKFEPKLGEIYQISVVPSEGDLYESKGSYFVESTEDLGKLRAKVLDLRKSNHLVYIKPD